MKSKNYYRVELFNGANDAAFAVVKAAAYVNGGDYKLDLSSIAKMGEAENCADTTVEIAGNQVRVDVKIENGYCKTVCIIEQVEVLELEQSPTLLLHEQLNWEE